MIIPMPQNTPEWLQFRRSRIGASDAPIIMNVSPYKTLLELWRDKKSDKESECNDAMIYGKKNEEPARLLFEEMTGLVMFPNFMAINDNHEWQIASLDGITIEQNAIVEIKCANKKDHELARSGLIPPKYLPQIQHQLACTGLDEAYYFSWRENDGVIVIVKRDQEYIDHMTEKEEHFYTYHLLGNVQPAMAEKDFKKLFSEDQVCTLIS